MAKYAGRKGLIYVAPNGTGVALSVIGLTAWSLDKTTDKIDVTSFGDVNKTYVQGLPDVKGTFSGNWDSADTKIFAAAASADGTKIYLYPSNDILTAYHYGPAWLDASCSVDVTGAVKITGNFVANGAWGDKGFSA